MNFKNNKKIQKELKQIREFDRKISEKYKHKKNSKWKLIERLKRLSKSFDEIGELWSQWILINCFDFDDHEIPNKYKEWNSHNFHKDKQKYQICLCSHFPIKILNFMENKETKERCVIGSCCINKFKEDTKTIKIQQKIILGEKEGKRYCKLCKRKLPDSMEKWKTYHKNCYFRKGIHDIYFDSSDDE